MEQETLVTKLNGVIGETNLSERTISEYAKNILPMITSDEMVTEDFLETHGNILKSIGGQLRHDLADGIEKFKKDYKPTVEKQKPTENPDKNDKYDALMAKIQSLENNIAEKDKAAAKNATKEKVISALREKIKEATGQNPNEFIFKATVRDIEFGENDTFESIVKNAQKEYDKNYTDAGFQTVQPRFGAARGKGVNKVADSFFADKAKKEGWSKK